MSVGSRRSSNAIKTVSQKVKGRSFVDRLKPLLGKSKRRFRERVSTDGSRCNVVNDARGGFV